MARKKDKNNKPGFMMFNVTYADGSVTSNRRVSLELLDQSFGDPLLDLALSAINAQDEEIAQRAKQRRAKIEAITKV